MCFFSYKNINFTAKWCGNTSDFGSLPVLGSLFRYSVTVSECVFILPARAHIKFARTEMILSLSTRVRASLGTFFWTFVSFYQKRGMHNGHWRCSIKEIWYKRNVFLLRFSTKLNCIKPVHFSNLLSCVIYVICMGKVSLVVLKSTKFISCHNFSLVSVFLQRKE